jgi:hypothetical protein
MTVHTTASSGADMRLVFNLYLVLITGGLVLAVVIGLLRV